MKPKHKITLLHKIGKNIRNKPTYNAICSCGKEYEISYKEFRHFKCNNIEKLPEKILFDRYKYSANKRGYKMELNLTHFKIISQQNCVYCESPPNMILKNEKFNGIDRRDNTKNYTLENSLPCCGTCNKLKGSLDMKEFVKKISNIYHNYIKICHET